MSITTAIFLASIITYLTLVGPGSFRRPSPVKRHRQPGLPTARLHVPVPSLQQGSEPVWWLDLTLPVPR